jgi:hypothetical protein
MLAPADVTIVVDVFSFTTCVDVATSRGASILPYAWNDASAAEFARDQRAELAGRRRQARYSLAPESQLLAVQFILSLLAYMALGCWFIWPWLQIFVFLARSKADAV